MFATLTIIGAIFGLMLAIFKDYLKGHKIWPRKHEDVVASSISITALLISLVNTIPYLILVIFVYHDWLVMLRTFATVILTLFTLVVGIGFWVGSNRGVNMWTLLLRSLGIGRAKRLYEVLIVPQDAHEIAKVQEQFPHLAITRRRGGEVFVVDRCDSLKKLAAITQQYQNMGMYVTYIEVAA